MFSDVLHVSWMSSDWLLGGFTALCSSTRGQHCAISTPLFTQPPGDVILTQGQTATLKCTSRSLNEYSYVYWYKQEVNSYPKFILNYYRGEVYNSPEFVKDRFDAELKDSSVPLMIRDLHLCDSAVYYCSINSTLSVYHNLQQSHLNVLIKL
uniref:Ig-like domain-containing protein n=1 Tax=Gouania willdenowi TaxID=441366 RepID=A0A8C5GNS0_GOUWI